MNRNEHRTALARLRHLRGYWVCTFVSPADQSAGVLLSLGGPRNELARTDQRERRIRNEVHVLPPLEFSGETLTSEREWQRAYVLVTFLAQAYIWMEWGEGTPGQSAQDPGCALEDDCRSS